jgi:hypothetical protein
MTRHSTITCEWFARSGREWSVSLRSIEIRTHSSDAGQGSGYRIGCFRDIIVLAGVSRNMSL